MIFMSKHLWRIQPKKQTLRGYMSIDAGIKFYTFKKENFFGIKYYKDSRVSLIESL